MRLAYGLIFTVLFAGTAYSEAKIGEKAPTIEIKGENGGKTDGTGWNSDTIKGKVYSLFYVDPDEKDSNQDLEAAIKKEDFDKAKYGSIAVVNLAATWKPNFVIEKILAGKQEDYPDTIYVKDKVSTLVKSWKLKDDAYNVLLFSKTGSLLYKHAGTLAKADIVTYLKLIKDNM